MKTIPYQCCFCQKPGSVQYNEPENVSRPHLDRLIASLPNKIACDPCAGFERSRRDIFRAVMAKAHRWSMLDMPTRESISDKTVNWFNAALSRFCQIHENRFHRAIRFEQSMTQEAMDNPNAARLVLRQIQRMARV